MIMRMVILRGMRWTTTEIMTNSTFRKGGAKHQLFYINLF